MFEYKKRLTMYDPQDDDCKCHQCGRDYDSHTEDQHDECDLKSALDEMPKKGLRFLVYRNTEQLGKFPEFGRWEWFELGELLGNTFVFVKLAVKDGEILEDLG